MKKILLPLITSFLFLTGCTTLNRSAPTSQLSSEVKNTLKADIKVDMSKKIKGQSSNSILFGFLEISGPDKFADGVFTSPEGGILSSLMGGGSDPLKAAAAYQALKSGGNVDVIVAPQYIVERKSYLIFSTTTVQVSGYPGIIQKIE